MIVRERSQVSASPRKASEWPPKSPLEALLSSPSGRRRYNSIRTERSVSPSPTKRISRHTERFIGDAHIDRGTLAQSDRSEEDAEILRLELQAIETRLKLKRLQRSQEPVGHARIHDNTGATHSQSLEDVHRIPQHDSRAVSQAMQVPLSPPRRGTELVAHTSPARVALGIDKGLKAQNVSLKRPYVEKRATDTSSTRASASTPREGPNVPIKSFSDRVRESRATCEEKLQRAVHIESLRTTSFGYRDLQDDSDTRRDEAPRRFQDLQQRVDGIIKRANIGAVSSSSDPAVPRSVANRQKPRAAHKSPAVSLEAFSGLHLSKRNIPHEPLTRLLANKALYTLPKLLKEVKSPDYEPPDVEGDFVVFAIVAAKSSPREHASVRKTTTTNDADDDAKANGKSKFMILRLVDLKWELDLFLFGTAFQQFWKLNPGTLVAILNPGIMPPRGGLAHSGAFALKISSSDDTVLEIGTARDLGFCDSIKKDGQQCNAWVNCKKTKYCEFHVNLLVDKTRAGRMEVNTMGRFGARRGSHSPERTRYSRMVPQKPTRQEKIKDAQKFDYDTRSQYYALPRHAGRSAAEALDSMLEMDAVGRGLSKQEHLQRLEKERQREHDLARQLASMGSNAGGDYMRTKGMQSDRLVSGRLGSAQSVVVGQSKEEKGAALMDLSRKRAAHVSLRPAKRKHYESNANASEPVGWGGAYKRGLLLDKKITGPSIDHESSSPQKKRTRFMLEHKGLRTPGRNSLGDAVTAKAGSGPGDDDDDDDLEIV